jgi:hydroxyacylglutathione hydrolase
LKWKLKADSLRQVGKSTLPTTIAHEKRVNPFLRCDTSSVIKAVQRHCEEDQLKSSKIHEPVEVFTSLRAWKDIYK